MQNTQQLKTSITQFHAILLHFLKLKLSYPLVYRFFTDRKYINNNMVLCIRFVC